VKQFFKYILYQFLNCKLFGRSCQSTEYFEIVPYFILKRKHTRIGQLGETRFPLNTDNLADKAIFKRLT